jgi:Maltokinase N-terminal cap domain
VLSITEDPFHGWQLWPTLEGCCHHLLKGPVLAEIHHTTLNPTKLELLTAWLPQQPWYVGDGSPVLAKAGGFRLDDPAGEVGIEFMVVADHAIDPWVYYQVPMAYRDAPRWGAEGSLIGITEHGVLGTRWVYDGVSDPVVLIQLAALMQGAVPAQAQAQAQSNALDPFVVVHPSGSVVASPTIVRLLESGGSAASTSARVSGVWLAPDGSELRGALAVG